MASETQARSGLAILWVSWTISLFISLAFAVLGAVTFNSLQKAYNRYPVGSDKAVLHGTMAAALGAPILVVLLDLFSLLILFYKTWKHNGTGFSYGFLDASFLHQGLFVFLSSYVLLSDRGIVQEFKETKLWTKLDATIYTFTYILGFVVTGVFVLLFGLLIVFQSAVRENHDKARRPRYPEEYDERLLDQDSRPPTPGGSVA